jgi:hypothetical protein
MTFRHTRLTICLGIAFFALLAPRALASAANCAAPPGTSGIDQYCEVLPAPGGSGSHHNGGGKNHSTPVNRVPAATRKQLQKQGDAGAAVLSLTQSAPASPANSTPAPQAPATTQHSHHRHRATGSQPSSPTPEANPTQAPAAPASNPAAAVGNSFGGSLGAAFIVLLVGIAVVMAGAAWLGRRRRPAEG